MINRLLTAFLFTFGATLPFLAIAFWWKGWAVTALIFGIIYSVAATMMIISICAVAGDEERNDEP